MEQESRIMRLIDAETLKVSITRYCAKHAEHQKWRRLKDHTSELCRDICFAIDAMPTEVEERKTGRWVYSDSDAERYDDIRCSVCGKHFTVDAERWCDIGFIASALKFCPECGARMEDSKQ